MPGLPVLIYDGDCRFCRRWIEAWREATGDRVEYVASQECAGRFPQIATEEFARAVQWVGADGSRCEGAEAVFSALATARWDGRMALRLYRGWPLFARVADAAYGIVARNREFFSMLTRWLWGNDVRPPSYAISSWIFLRALGVIYLIAFLSYGAQVDGLTGSKGILPAAAFFEAAGRSVPDAAWQWPSVLWWTGAGDAALHSWCWAGVVAAALLVVGIAPAPCLIFLWAVYLSLMMAGQIFYQFQWDILLLEAGFLAIFLAPWQWWARKLVEPPRVAHFLLIWLLFRLMFASGVVKLSSGDASWADGTALDFHYFTQPLPTPLAWHVQQLPTWFQWLSVKGMFFCELVLPFLLFAPRRPRLAAAGGIVFLQAIIALTGNYGFFNLLTVALCLLAVDDAVFGVRNAECGVRKFLPRWFLWPVAIALFLLSLVPLASAFRRPLPWLAPLADVYNGVAPFRTINGYGLFAVMTKERREIIVQGSDDALNWKTYTFRYKPGDLRRAPPWVAPYMPRLDWQMWFAALGPVEQSPWFVNFLLGLLDGSPPVLGLLEENPFPGKPPRYVRALTDDYTFTTAREKRAAGEWWKAEPRAIFYPEVSLKN